ncbi:zinc-finger homeodomain protein 4-like [Neltuma alba]|uniref:zinc-finger homeodomain protein 4-like n=1 Tax=Neltuma alba TaxID=207710 RepID=UPI0010A4229C|nr:zinc-finger homeodomain protein 4-like [Prosopis alba]XP_028805622.1 zinc-finger homeodomain protein 4-like [Prosopis alba]
MESRNVHIDHQKRPSVEEPGPEKKNKKQKKTIISYKECLKNHAASIGGNATDGCGEFMAAGEEGTPESLKCSACKCHRNFHRKHFESEDSDDDTPSSPYYDSRRHHHHHHHHLLNLPSQMMMLPNNDDHDQVEMKPLLTHDLCLTSYNKSGSNGSSDHESDEKRVVMRKRFRTKFSEEQKEKMLRFAEKVGWKMQKVDESMVQQFCEEAGIKRRVLKVWMHNNKNNLAKRNLLSTS